MGVARSFPEELRRYGRALPAIVDPQVSLVPHARFASVPSDGTFLGDDEIVRTIVATLASNEIETVLDEQAALTLLAALASPAHTPPGIRQRAVAAMTQAKVALPSRLKFRLKPPYRGPDTLTAPRLAFRATVGAKALALLRDDARLSTGAA